MIVFRITGKFRSILSRHQKIRILELFFMMILSGFMEMLSVALIIPFVQTIFSPDDMMNNRIVISVMNLLGLQIYQTFLIFLSLLMVFLYFFKNAFLVFQMTIQERFVQNNQFSLQLRLLRSFLYRPYEFFLSTNSGDILRIVMSDTLSAFVALTTLISLFSELIVALILVVAVFLITPFITLVMAFILLIAVGVINVFSKGVVRKAGEEYQASTSLMYQTLLHAIEGIKEVKLSRKEKYFEEKYAKGGWKYVRATYINTMAAALPRYLIETFAMCGFFLVLAGMIYGGIETKVLMPAISGVAMASVRLLPCANRIAASISSLNYYEPAVDKLIENMSYLEEGEEIPSPSPSSMVMKKMGGNHQIDKLKSEILARDVSYTYPTGDRMVLDHATLKITRGQSVGIVGASGAGKTTAVDVILGLLHPQNGEILIDGTDIRLDMEGWLSQIGYIPQTIFMMNGTIRENVAFGADDSEIDDIRVWEALREASLDEFIRSLPEGIDTNIGDRGIRISGGQRQRIGIARALYTDPEILFFDEATSSLDNETEAAIMESINNLHGKKTMIIIAHRLTTIEKCDVVYRVENGGIEKVS